MMYQEWTVICFEREHHLDFTLCLARGPRQLECISTSSCNDRSRGLNEMCIARPRAGPFRGRVRQVNNAKLPLYS